MDHKLNNLTIDRNNLDQELVEHPEMLRMVSEALVEANSLRDGMKEKYEFVAADRELVIRATLAQSRDKVTEGIIKAELTVDEARQTAYNEYLAACAHAAKMAGLKEAWQARGYVLKDLCTLYVAGYWSSNSVKGEAVSRVTDRTYEQNKANMAQQRRRI